MSKTQDTTSQDLAEVTVTDRGRVVWTGQIRRDQVARTERIWRQDMGTGRTSYRITVR